MMVACCCCGGGVGGKGFGLLSSSRPGQGRRSRAKRRRRSDADEATPTATGGVKGVGREQRVKCWTKKWEVGGENKRLFFLQGGLLWIVPL